MSVKEKEPKNTYYSTVALTFTQLSYISEEKEIQNTQYTTIECLPPLSADKIERQKKYSTAFLKEAGLFICNHPMNISLGFDSKA